jgi:hypothetical protein
MVHQSLEISRDGSTISNPLEPYDQLRASFSTVEGKMNPTGIIPAGGHEPIKV